MEIKQKNYENIIDAVCHQIDKDELNEYIKIILDRIKIISNNHKEVLSIVDGKAVKKIDNPIKYTKIKKLIFFHMIQIDGDWFKNWIYENRKHQYNESLPKKIGIPFFIGLFKLCEENIEFRIADDKFLTQVKKLYDEISNDHKKRKII